MTGLNRTPRSRGGFTLVELIVVLVRIFTTYYGVGIRCMA